jgi:hypothetical protein
MSPSPHVVSHVFPAGGFPSLEFRFEFFFTEGCKRLGRLGHLICRMATLCTRSFFTLLIECMVILEACRVAVFTLPKTVPGAAEFTDG